ncbi:MAG: hypothetical protein A2Y41_03910 [Spirochaetes bacterium GWB1_36_13]|nr:MAG: hypothetical protein A2Y41_03910 [Spirochaetes bacterium GWB1_36_13]
MKQLISLLLLVVSSLVLVSCGSIVNGGKQEISIDSNIQGVEVELNGTKIGVTPLKYEVSRKSEEPLSFTLKKDGYTPQTVQLNSSISGWFWGNILIGGFFGSSTDYSTGGMYQYSPDNYFIEMQSSSAMETEKDKKSNYLRYFVLMNYDRIQKDISTGEGKYLDSLNEIYGKKNTADSIEFLFYLREVQHNSKTMMDFTNNLLTKI